MPRPCSICASPHAAAVRQRVTARAADDAIAREFGFSRHAVARHRINHIEAIARAVAQKAGKGAEAREKRAALVSGTATDLDVYLAREGIASRLKVVEDRLERAAAGAEEDGQRMAVASLSGQAIRAIEACARIAGVGQDREKDGGRFQLRIFLGDRPLVIEGGEGGRVIEGEPVFSGE